MACVGHEAKVKAEGKQEQWKPVIPKGLALLFSALMTRVPGVLCKLGGVVLLGDL